MNQLEFIFEKSERQAVALAVENQKQELHDKLGRLFKHGGRKGDVINCDYCGSDFIMRNTRSRFCSQRCYESFKREKKKKITNPGSNLFNLDKEGSSHPVLNSCVVCHSIFPSKYKSCYCSPHCRSVAVSEGVKNRLKKDRSSDVEKHLNYRWGAIRCSIKSGRTNRSNIRFYLKRGDLFDIWNKQGGLCAITGVQMTHKNGVGFVLTNVSVDRIDNSGPYSKENVRLVCRIVNHMRFQMSDVEFLKWCNLVSKGLEKH